jgi:hypothetical protein
VARREHAAAVAIGIQADMFDPEAVAADQVYGFTPIVQELARRAAQFGKPLEDPSSVGSQLYHVIVPVPNLVRVTVQGSTNVPHEWTKLHVDPQTADVFSWQNVVL